MELNMRIPSAIMLISLAFTSASRKYDKSNRVRSAR